MLPSTPDPQWTRTPRDKAGGAGRVGKPEKPLRPPAQRSCLQRSLNVWPHEGAWGAPRMDGWLPDRHDGSAGTSVPPMRHLCVAHARKALTRVPTRSPTASRTTWCASAQHAAAAAGYLAARQRRAARVGKASASALLRRGRVGLLFVEPFEWVWFWGHVPRLRPRLQPHLTRRLFSSRRKARAPHPLRGGHR